jgi:hypothetical protein
MTLIRFAQRSNILVNALPSNPFRFLLITLITLTGLGSISGCTDKAAELHARKCTNIKNLIEEKSKSAPKGDLIGLSFHRQEMDKLDDEFKKECR